MMFAEGEGDVRIAVVSDIHGNLTALEAVLGDLRQMAPDLVLHGGDLADGGASPAEIVDQIRALGWKGVLGNSDEMLFAPEALTGFAHGSPAMKTLLAPIQETAAATRAALGEERLAWLQSLPLVHREGPLALVHASPTTCWRSPMPEATDAELESVYKPLAQPVVVYGHIHRSYIRSMPGLTVVNSGSVSLSYDGDLRASYLLLDGTTPQIRRVAYDVEREAAALRRSGLPHADWIAKILKSGSFQMP